MQLQPEEVARFFKIWFPVLHYVNEKRHLVPSFPASWGQHRSVDPQDAFPLRNALWEDDSLREAFIADNPAKLSPEDLALVASWQYRVEGKFFIYRYLKKYTVFLDDKSPAHAYGVLGLASSIQDIAGPYLPIYVEAVLLPFENRIIYDSLIAPYSVYFGGGIRSGLNDSYRDIQEREGITTTLLPTAESLAPTAVRKDIQARNKKILIAFQKDLGRAGLSPKMILEHVATIEKFAQAHLLKQKSPRGLLELLPEDLEEYIPKTHANPVSFKRFGQFLRDSGRIDYGQAEDLLDHIKSLRG